jgi:hypothetical protein
MEEGRSPAPATGRGGMRSSRGLLKEWG